MKWCEISGFKLRYIEYNTRLYMIELMDEDNAIIPLANSTKPLTLTISTRDTYSKALYNLYKKTQDVEPVFESFLDKIAPKWIEILIKNKITADDLLAEEERKKSSEEKQHKSSFDLYYETLYAEFRDYLLQYDMSALELIVSVSRCLVANNSREVIRAFIGYFQSINGFKATNVIAIGNPASGKSFILESALSMIPSEFIHEGAMSEAAFFEEFDGRDITGHIFYLGDLGGIKDDENTIIFRDLLKRLSTDGEVSRTIMRGDKNSMEPVKQTIRGNPSLSYSTALEEMINPQEKSRSIILTPKPIEPSDLLVFNAVMRNHGVFYDSLTKLEMVRESIKGLVYCFNRRNYDFFNPYMFNVIESFEENDDFNRKIQEYDATLEVVTLLDKPISIQHDLYFNEDEKETVTKLVFPTKRDNLNAMNLFDATDLLPDEARFGDNLIQKFNVFDLDKYSYDLDKNNEELSFEEKVINCVTNEFQDWVSDTEEFTWENDYFYNPYNGYFSVKFKGLKDCFFSVSSLKKQYRNAKWFKTNKDYVSDRLRRLYDAGILINVGKTVKGENVYALNENNGDSISEKIPSFKKITKLNYCKDLFKQIFPLYIKEFDDFLNNDDDNPIEKSITEVVPALFMDLPYIKKGD